MSTENNQEQQNEKWPVPSTLRGVFGDNFEYMVRGWLIEISKKILSPVIFVHHDPTKMDKEGDLKIFDDTRDYKNTASELCNWLRYNDKCCDHVQLICCNKHDEKAANIALQQSQPNPPALTDGWDYIPNGLLGDDSEGIHLYTYPCPLTGLIEWVVPLFVNEIFAGTVITGQFERDGMRKNAEQIRDYLISCGVPNAEKIDTQEIAKRKGIPEPQIGAKNRNDFFSELAQIQSSINNEYKEVAAYRIQVIQSKLMDMIWDKGGFYLETHAWDMKSILSIEPRFRAARTYLVDCVVYLKRILYLEGLTVFMPCMNLDRLDASDTSANVVEGVVVDDELEKRMDDHLAYNRTFPAPGYKLQISEKDWKDGQSEGHIPSLTRREEACRPVLAAPASQELARKILYVFAAKGYERYPVAYLFTLPINGSTEIENWEKQDSWIHELLEQLSTAYLAQWNMIFADYHRLSYEMGNRYLSHELGQIIAGMRVRIGKFEEFLAAVHANLDEYRLPRPLSRLVDDADVFTKDQYSYLQMFTTISKNAFFFTDKQKISKERFFPYDKFLYRLVSVYQAENDFYGRKVILPIISVVDPLRPKLYADPVLLEQAVNNLLRNACKYSHSYTKIYMNAQLSDDGTEYLFSVTNFGIPIPKEEEQHLSELGYRASNARLKDATGIGFGLYIVKKFAELHKGRMELQQTPISDYCIPFLKPYIFSTHPQKDAAVDLACREELARLIKEGSFTTVVADRMPDSPFTPLYYLNHIEDATAEITFIIHIPMMKE